MSAPLQVRRSGSNAALIDCGSLAEALELFAALTAARQSGELCVDELVPAAQTVLVRGGVARRPQDLSKIVTALRSAHTEYSGRSVAPHQTTLQVVYDGEDLEEVAQISGLTIDEVISRHTSATYHVAFTGFAPGFAYLSGGDSALIVPRRSTPRPRILPGAVGLAGAFTGVYPRESPGGWQLIGRTDALMWDLERDPPALLTPGNTVRFEAVRASVHVPESHTAAAQNDAAQTDTAQNDAVQTDAAESDTAERGTPAFTVIDPGLVTLVQDEGRPGFAALGVSASGAADRSAYAAANSLVGNDVGAAVLEIGLGACEVLGLDTLVLSLTGARRTATVAGPFGLRNVQHDRAFRIDAGERLKLGPPTHGLRTTLAIRGGIATPLTLGSASRDTLAGLGPKPIAAGDTISTLSRTRSPVTEAATPGPALPVAGDETLLRVISGPRDDWFGADGMRELWNTLWEVTSQSDRIGVRLAGTPLNRLDEYVDVEPPSEGISIGSIQVPTDGQPVLFLADCPVTGGYPVIGVLHEDDLDLAAQLPPGAFVRFTSDNQEKIQPTRRLP